MNILEKKRATLIKIMVRYGYPQEYGIELANTLKTEKAMTRMISYLLHGKPKRIEDIADEMVAILEEHHRWMEKKKAEYANQKYNELLAKGIEDE